MYARVTDSLDKPLANITVNQKHDFQRLISQLEKMCRVEVTTGSLTLAIEPFCHAVDAKITCDINHLSADQLAVMTAILWCDENDFVTGIHSIYPVLIQRMKTNVPMPASVITNEPPTWTTMPLIAHQ